jgi:hypothetical protein
MNRIEITFLMDLLRTYAEPILNDIYEQTQWCDEEYLENAYRLGMRLENAFISFVLLIPIAKHPSTPRHIIKELMENQFLSVSCVAKKHPSMREYEPFQ